MCVFVVVVFVFCLFMCFVYFLGYDVLLCVDVFVVGVLMMCNVLFFVFFVLGVCIFVWVFVLLLKFRE